MTEKKYTSISFPACIMTSAQRTVVPNFAKYIAKMTISPFPGLCRRLDAVITRLNDKGFMDKFVQDILSEQEKRSRERSSLQKRLSAFRCFLFPANGKYAEGTVKSHAANQQKGKTKYR